MGESALKRNTALRLLHENFGAPLALLQQASGAADRFVDRLAVREKWKPALSAMSLHGGLMQLFERQIGRLSKTADETACEEKHARALATLAKTL